MYSSRNPYIDDEAQEAEPTDEEEDEDEEKEKVYDWTQHLTQDCVDECDLSPVLRPSDGPLITPQLCRRVQEQIKHNTYADVRYFNYKEDISHLPEAQRHKVGEKIVCGKYREFYRKNKNDYRISKQFFVQEDDSELFEPVKKATVKRRKRVISDDDDDEGEEVEKVKKPIAKKSKAVVNDDDEDEDMDENKVQKVIVKNEIKVMVNSDGEDDIVSYQKPVGKKAKKFDDYPSEMEDEEGDDDEIKHLKRMARKKHDLMKMATQELPYVSDDDEESRHIPEPHESYPEFDFSKVKASKDETPFTIKIGEGYELKAQRIFFQSPNNGGASFFGISVIKHIPLDDVKYWSKKNAKDPQINFPLRNLESLNNALSDMKAKIVPVPTVKEFATMASNSDGTVDLSGYGYVMPKIQYKIDDMFFCRGDRVKWGKAMVEVVLLERLSKDPKKKGYNLQIPARLFDSFAMAVEYLYNTKCNDPTNNEKN